MIKAVDHERHNVKSILPWQGCIEIFQRPLGPGAARVKSICTRKIPQQVPFGVGQASLHLVCFAAFVREDRGLWWG
jgi:hypothetical protein